MKQWVKMPTKWIVETDILKRMKWKKENNAQNIAALMVYMAIIHDANSEPVRDKNNIGEAILSYTQLMEITSLSKVLVIKAVDLLVTEKLISKNTDSKVNKYSVIDYEINPWGKLPAKKLYDSKFQKIEAFKHFHLRKKVELHAMKIYFLLVALRNNLTNSTRVSFDKISEYTGIQRNDIKFATSFLVTSELITVTQEESQKDKTKFSNVYRLVGLDSYSHNKSKTTLKPRDESAVEDTGGF